jgi:hypothetical protein
MLSRSRLAVHGAAFMFASLLLFLSLQTRVTTGPSDTLALSAAGVEGAFGIGGPSLSLGNGHAISVRFEGMGREVQSAFAHEEAPRSVGNEIRYPRATGVVEWWRRAQRGLEQGLTIETRPPGDGPLTVAVSVQGTLHVAEAADRAARLADQSGQIIASYSGLTVLDRGGVPMPASMREERGRIMIRVDDTNARYPLVIDPIVAVEEANLVLPTREALDYFGISVAMSADGSRIIAGASLDDTAAGVDSGSARVYVRNGANWALEADLIPSDHGPNQAFGGNVAMSADGTRVAVGRAGHDPTAGAPTEGGFVVFLRVGTTWSEEESVPGPADPNIRNWPSSMYMSDDGTRVVCGTPTYVTSWGHAAVYVRTGGAWILEQSLPVGVPPGGTYWGMGVAISGDASRIAISVPGDDPIVNGNALTNAGTVYVYRRSGSTWLFEATLVSSEADPSEAFGNSADSLAFSRDGSRLVVGSAFDDQLTVPYRGSGVVFVRTANTWTEEAILIPPGALTGDHVGFSVAISADGTQILLGAPNDTIGFGGGHGSAHLFERTNTTWSHVVGYTASVPENNAQFGYDVALSADGTRAVMGSPLETVPNVAAWVGSVRIVRFENQDDNGASCNAASDCLSGFCADGVCCDTECGDSAADDCEVCSIAAGGTTDGTCGALSVATATTVTCRGAAGGCDAPEVCSALSTACPPDLLQAATFVCRGAQGVCDVEEACDGATPDCPTDVFLVDATTCAPADMCSDEDTCVSGVCTEGASVDCDDNDACTTDACGTAGCTNDDIDGCCNVNADCNDNDACTEDSCSGAGGTCTNAPIAGCGADAGTRDAAPADARPADAAVASDASVTRDAGVRVDSGPTEEPTADEGCGCTSTRPARPSSSSLATAAVVLLFTGLSIRRRRR